LIKSYSKDMYNVRKDYILNKCCSFELSILSISSGEAFFVCGCGKLG